METVNNVVNAASKAIWGNPTAQSGEEPVSGQTGAGTVNEPYDKGNVEGQWHPSAIIALSTAVPTFHNRSQSGEI
jgi:hypothetical protein